MVVVLIACALGAAWGFVPPFHPPQRCLVKTEALKANDPKESRPRQRPKPKKPPMRRIDPALAMTPVPLVPDINGNWEAVVSDLWLEIENTCKLTELKRPDSDLSRFRKFCDNYRTQRGTLTGPAGRAVSAQTRLLDVDDASPAVMDLDNFKFARRLATRMLPVILEEFDAAMESGRLNNSWSRDEIMAVREELWDGPPRPRDDDDDEEDVGTTAAATPTDGSDDQKKEGTPVAVAAAVESETPAEAAPLDPPPPPPPPLTEVWSQLQLHQTSPLAIGVLRFPRTMRLLDKFKAIRPPPRNVIVGRLPPGTKTAPRSDLQNFALTFQMPIKGCDGASSGIIVGDTKVPWKVGEPVVFDPTFSYSMYNDGPEDAYVLHVDFWHPDVTEDERQLLAYFWMLWQQDKRVSEFHPSTRSKFTRRVNFRKEVARKEREERKKKLKRSGDKKDGGGGSIARK
ncbi:hypothetical protein CTAYLR_003624 [Chrysophaeum taylorii]|uniref:Aspartyl/asparaginy/proline hydroxylase domain-containing protein n=1 Tax=Chrysophaeum taylorii TaxID=2483200 RepID=A0AAD7UCF4_9STRA|nr:hypothetical protein CTAYLR_003624 [Chrysophaeum taylorii]